MLASIAETATRFWSSPSAVGKKRHRQLESAEDGAEAQAAGGKKGRKVAVAGASSQAQGSAQGLLARAAATPLPHTQPTALKASVERTPVSNLHTCMHFCCFLFSAQALQQHLCWLCVKSHFTQCCMCLAFFVQMIRCYCSKGCVPTGSAASTPLFLLRIHDIFHIHLYLHHSSRAKACCTASVCHLEHCLQCSSRHVHLQTKAD